jgi:hypothetical protein
VIPSHPEYPVLIPGFIARCWTYAGEMPQSVPTAMGGLLYLSTVAIGAGGMAVLRGGSLGLLFGLTLAGTPFFLYQVPWEYADTPLAAFIAGGVILLLLGRPIEAGLMASLAAWTKHEGGLFLAVLLAAVLLFRRRSFVKAGLGAVPVLTVLIFYKTVLARGADSLLNQSASALPTKGVDGSRYGTVLAAMAGEFREMMMGAWYHPLLPFIVLAVALGFRKELWRDVRLVVTVLGGMLAGYAIVYVATPGGPSELDWFLRYSVARIFAQIWPVFLIAGFIGLRAPEETTP